MVRRIRVELFESQWTHLPPRFIKANIKYLHIKMILIFSAVIIFYLNYGIFPNFGFWNDIYI